MATGLYSGVSGLAIGVGLNKGVTGLWSGASGLITGWGATAFNPLSLFAASEPGAWYDPSDLSTMFQDTAGTTPVTATGQTVGLLLDKSKGLVLGPELVGAFTVYANASFSTVGGVTTVTCTSNGSYGIQLGFTGAAGKTYLMSFNVVSNSAPRGVFGWSSLSSSVALSAGTTTGTKTGYLLATAGGSGVIAILGATAGETFSISNISVKELPGNHATQATAASRPIYGIEPFGGRRNLLTFTEQFDNAVWAVINGASKISAASFSLNAPNSRFYQGVTMAAGAAYTLQFTFSAGDEGKSIRLTYYDSFFGWILTPDITIPSSGLLTYTFTPVNSATFAGVQGASTQSGTTTFTIFSGKGAQLETGSVASAYQRVTDQWNVTEAGKASVSYLAFDGTDDFLVTGTITPGIDKAQVFAGVRKLSDAASGMVAELSTSWASNAGTLFLHAPESSGTGAYSGGSRGAAGLQLTQRVVFNSTAPDTRVVTFTHDISGDLTVGRMDGVQQGTATGDKGTGNFLAYPLYIGRRAGTTLPFNGRIYQMLVRFGANLSAATITQTETWMNSKTGAYLPPDPSKFTVLGTSGSFATPTASLSADGTSYATPKTVLAANGTSYTPL